MIIVPQLARLAPPPSPAKTPARSSAWSLVVSIVVAILLLIVGLLFWPRHAHLGPALADAPKIVLPALAGAETNDSAPVSTPMNSILHQIAAGQ
ncbi:MAG TPA: hypothetical protein VNU95_06775, partial [Candidatus Acidoferrales bacterium]|nr:hypothetical protein [Candidatus Acidoferrales bacterium]